jgi:hypothetical protein
LQTNANHFIYIIRFAFGHLRRHNIIHNTTMTKHRVYVCCIAFLSCTYSNINEKLSLLKYIYSTYFVIKTGHSSQLYYCNASLLKGSTIKTNPTEKFNFLSNKIVDFSGVFVPEKIMYTHSLMNISRACTRWITSSLILWVYLTFTVVSGVLYRFKNTDTQKTLFPSNCRYSEFIKCQLPIALPNTQTKHLKAHHEARSSLWRNTYKYRYRRHTQ